MRSNIENFEANVRKEASILVDKVLEESVNIVNNGTQNRQYEFQIVTQTSQNQHQQQDLNSESDNYAITCDDVGGLDVVKSPTIESMSGKSFDDNMSFTDEHLNLPITTQTSINIDNTDVTTTTSISSMSKMTSSSGSKSKTSAIPKLKGNCTV